MSFFLISHNIKWQKHQQIFLKNAGFCVISHFYSWYGIQMHLAIRKDHLCLQIIRCIFWTSQKQDTWLWKFYPISAPLLLGMFYADCKIIFDHAYCHCSIICTLAFNMIHFLSNQQGVCNNLSVLLLVFITKLCDLHIFRIWGMKYFIDQWNCQIRHLLNHGTEYIIKNGIVHMTLLFVPTL